MAWKDYESETLENLIEFIQWRNQPEYSEVAADAFKVVCFRFRDDIIRKCRIISKNWGYDEQIGDIIAERTFERFWKYPSFSTEKCKKEISSCFKFYLYRIAQNQLADYRKEELGIGQSSYTGEEQIIRDFPNIESIGEAKRDIRKKFEIILKALERLTPKHKIIYLTYKTHEIDGRKLPRHLLKSLREELDLTQASVQVYKKEAYDKINEYLDIYGSK